MKPEIIDYIVCPKCKSNFSVSIESKNKLEIIKGQLICKNKHNFKIKKGVPQLIDKKNKIFVDSETAFSAKWKKFYKKYQTEKWYNFTNKWFYERFGWKNQSEFKIFLSDKRLILDAGTGIGNSAKRLAINSNNIVFAIDGSESIFFAYDKFKKHKNIHFIQADIFQLPFKQKFFDYICSDQVLHHTKNTKQAFKKLVRTLKKNGKISVYVYKKKGPIREFVDDYLRQFTTKMTEKECMEFSKTITNFGRTIAKMNKKITIKEDIPLLEIKAGKYDLQRFLYWNIFKCFWAEDGDFDRSLGINFDWYSPKFAFRHTLKEVKEWHKEMNLKIIHKDIIDSGISTTAIKK